MRDGPQLRKARICDFLTIHPGYCLAVKLLKALRSTIRYEATQTLLRNPVARMHLTRRLECGAFGTSVPRASGKSERSYRPSIHIVGLSNEWLIDLFDPKVAAQHILLCYQPVQLLVEVLSPVLLIVSYRSYRSPSSIYTNQPSYRSYIGQALFLLA